MKNVINRFSAIKAENRELVSYLIPKAIENEQTIYGELCDWLRDYHNDLTLQEREVLCKMLLGDMVIHHPEWVRRISTKERIMAIEFDSYHYKRDMLSKLSDVEKYFLWRECDEVNGYSLDEFSADFNDEAICTQDWLYFVDATECREALENGAEVKLYKVWSDSESAYDVPDDAPYIFKDLDAACNFASECAHEYDGEQERAIFHVDDMASDETIDTYENTGNKCDK